jgi:hypothetical protein
MCYIFKRENDFKGELNIMYYYVKVLRRKDMTKDVHKFGSLEELAKWFNKENESEMTFIVGIVDEETVNKLGMKILED